MSSERNRMTISGNVIHGSQVFANGPVRIDQNVGASYDDLRAALQQARATIVDAGRDPDEREQLEQDVGAVLRELDRDEPKAAVVRRRWDTIREVLGQVLAHSGDIARIGEIVTGLPG